MFGQELGHYWLAYPTIDHPELEADALLGRSASHWSYWLDTGNSPVEGNAWLDNGDGTFTTDLDRVGTFSPLDLYLMGFVGPEEVPPFFLVQTDADERADSSSPEHLWGEQPITVAGTRVELTIDDVIASVGPRAPLAADSPRDFTLLTILVLGPTELLTDELLERVRERQQQWTEAWTELTLGHSTVDFTIAEEALSAPPLSAAPTLIPRGAW